MQYNLDYMARLMQLLDPVFYAALQARRADNFFFCYRWFLTFFKREFPAMADVVYLWECLWAHEDRLFPFYFAL